MAHVTARYCFKCKTVTPHFNGDCESCRSKALLLKKQEIEKKREELLDEWQKDKSIEERISNIEKQFVELIIK